MSNNRIRSNARLSWKEIPDPDRDLPRTKLGRTENDPVNHPRHYTTHPSGIECITITRHMSFNLGNVIKYIWRADTLAGVQDLQKALWYLQDEINKREGKTL